MFEKKVKYSNADSVCRYISTTIRDRPFSVISITGFPALGKTTISRKVRDIRGIIKSLHIQAESWILPLRKRLDMGISGSSPRAYNVQKCRRDIEKLLLGEGIDLGIYSHSTGRVSESGRDTYIKGASLIILDGTLFSVPELASFSDIVYFLAPEVPVDWYLFAIDRDQSERGFSKRSAEFHNRNKYYDMLKLWDISKSGIDYTLIAKIERDSSMYEITYDLQLGASYEIKKDLDSEVVK